MTGFFLINEYLLTLSVMYYQTINYCLLIKIQNFPTNDEGESSHEQISNISNLFFLLDDRCV